MKERKEQMDNYRELLKFSIDYAIENNTFHSLNIINNPTNNTRTTIINFIPYFTIKS